MSEQEEPEAQEPEAKEPEVQEQATFDQLLDIFKSKGGDSAESLIQLINDPVLCNALVAWQATEVRRTKEELCPHSIEEEAACWKWLWTQVAFDQNKFGIMVNVQAHEISRIITRIVGLRLVYPDGTIHNMAKQYLRQVIMSKLPQKPKKPDAKKK